MIAGPRFRTSEKEEGERGKEMVMRCGDPKALPITWLGAARFRANVTGT